MSKRAVPQVPKPGEPRQQFDAALKENLEILQGVRGGSIKPLASTATTAEIIAAINAIIAKLQ